MRSVNAHPQLLGFWMCVALVVGNSIGSGVFLLPASLAPYGLNSVVAWGLTACGAVLLAVVFAQLSRAYPQAGGPYAYVRLAFGPFTAFIVAWGYWISIWVGNAAIATGAVSYLTPLANILETKDAYVLEAEMPGVTKDGLDVSIENGELTIVGRRAVAAPQGRAVYRESRGLDYRRSFELDPAIDTARINAKLDQGVLTLTLPKAEAVKPRKIAVTD